MCAYRPHRRVVNRNCLSAAASAAMHYICHQHGYAVLDKNSLLLPLLTGVARGDGGGRRCAVQLRRFSYEHQERGGQLEI